MALTSVFVCFNTEFYISMAAISARITRLSGCKVVRIDDVRSVTGRYCVVHFDQRMPEILWNMLSAGQEPIEIDDGTIRIGINTSNGLNPNTEDKITQYIFNDSESYIRDFKTGIVQKKDKKLNGWFVTSENPFAPEIQAV